MGNPWDPPVDERRKPGGGGKKRKTGKSRRQASTEEDDIELLTISPKHAEPLERDDRQKSNIRYGRQRANSCWCQRAGGCKDELDCCFEDDPHALECPCRSRLRRPEVAAIGKASDQRCAQCLEDGTLRTCCKTAYCKYCYEATGNCPRCGIISAGANKGKYGADLEAAQGEVREGEECRVCLKQGFRRRCCGEFYCASCYFNTGHCPSCTAPAERKVQLQRTPRDPGFVPVLLGYSVSLLVVLVALAIAGVAVANDKSLPETVFGYRCYGFFPVCSTDEKCLEHTGSVELGLPDPLTTWRYCDLNTVNKLFGRYCVHDKQIYVYSASIWGYDMCQNEFEGAVATFEDTFESWVQPTNFSTNLMASAQWARVVNGEAGKTCGASISEGSFNALSFSGPFVREAETKPLDVRYGGQLKFYFRMGPETLTPDFQECKPAYGGNVYIYYSTTTDDTSWMLLETLQTFLYRDENFQYVTLPLPANATSSATRFLIKQEDFEDDLEYWAIDDFRVMSNFKPNWQTSLQFSEEDAQDDKLMRQIKCCLNSEQCEASSKEQDTFNCKQFESIQSNERAIMGAERFVLLAGLFAFLKYSYSAMEIILLKGWHALLPSFMHKKQAKIFMADDPAPGVLDAQFSLKTGKLWRIIFLTSTCGTTTIAWLWCSSLLRNFYLVEHFTLGAGLAHPWHATFRIHVSGVFLLATWLDGLTIFFLARDVVCIISAWVPVIDLDLRASTGWLMVGEREIKLKYIKDMTMFSLNRCRMMALAHVVGGLPWCLGSLVAKYSYLPYDIQRFVTVLFGVAIIIRSWLGPAWVLQTAIALRWLVTTDMYDRDEVGGIFQAKKTRFMIAYGCVICSLAGAAIAALLHPGFAGIAFGVCFGAGVFYALMLSIVQGLPVTPKLLLSTVSKGMLLRVHRHVKCPCDTRLEMCGEMHSRDELMVLFVKDHLTFGEMLSGDDTIQTG